MLFMDIFTWKSEERDEVFKRGDTEKIPEGVKVLGDYIDIGGGRTFRLVDVADSDAFLAMTSFWTDLGSKELVPVIKAEEK